MTCSSHHLHYNRTGPLYEDLQKAENAAESSKTFQAALIYSLEHWAGTIWPSICCPKEKLRQLCVAEEDVEKNIVRRYAARRCTLSNLTDLGDVGANS